MGRKRKGFVSKFFFSPIKQEIGGTIKRGVRKRTKLVIAGFIAPRGTMKTTVQEALEFDRKRFRLKRR